MVNHIQLYTWGWGMFIGTLGGGECLLVHLGAGHCCGIRKGRVHWSGCHGDNSEVHGDHRTLMVGDNSEVHGDH